MDGNFEPRTERRWRSDWLPALLMGANSLATAVTFFYMAVYFDEVLGFSGTAIGVLFAVHAACALAVTVPAGLVNDRLSSRSLVLIAMVGQAASLAGLALVQGFWAVLAVYLLWGLANGLFKLSLDVQVLKTDSGRRTGGRIGLYQAGRFIGLGLGLVLAGQLLSRLGFERHLLLAAAGCVALVGLGVWLLPTPVGRVRWADYRADLRRPRVLLFAGWLLLFASHWGAEATAYGLFLRQDLALSMTGMGWYMVGEFAAIAATLLLLGRGLRDFRRLAVYAVTGLAVSGIGHVGMVFEPLALSLGMRLVHGVGDGLMFLVTYFGIARLFAVERLGGNTGFVAMATMLGYVLGALVYGPAGEAWGYGVPLVASGLIALGLAAGLLLLLRRPIGRPAVAPMGIGSGRYAEKIAPPRSGS